MSLRKTLIYTHGELTYKANGMRSTPENSSAKKTDTLLTHQQTDRGTYKEMKP